MEPAGPDVLADLLFAASEAGPETLVEVDGVLRSLLDDETVNAAHAVWTARLREWVEGSEERSVDPERVDAGVLDLVRRLRSGTSRGLRRAGR